MHPYLRASIICFAIVVLMGWLFFSVSCTGRSFYHSVRLPATLVTVIGGTDSPPAGMARRGEIIVTGEMRGGKIIPDEKVLAHEILHLLHWGDATFINPDLGE